MNQNLKQTALAVLATLGAKDPVLRKHCERVALLAVNIAEELGLPGQEADDIWLAGLVHDLGKVGIPWEIVYKPGILSQHERRLMESHVDICLNILREGAFPWPILSAVGQHHERMDGSGYPGRLKGDEIVPRGKILGVADVFDAMTSARSYRVAFHDEETASYLLKNKGILFEPSVVDAFMKVVSKMRVAAT